jgi:hypothetical protein
MLMWEKTFFKTCMSFCVDIVVQYHTFEACVTKLKMIYLPCALKIFIAIATNTSTEDFIIAIIHSL